MSLGLKKKKVIMSLVDKQNIYIVSKVKHLHRQQNSTKVNQRKLHYTYLKYIHIIIDLIGNVINDRVNATISLQNLNSASSTSYIG